MEMEICARAVPHLWPCSEPEVEGFIVKRAEFSLLRIKFEGTLKKKCNFATILIFIVLKHYGAQNCSDENILEHSVWYCWRTPPKGV